MNDRSELRRSARLGLLMTVDMPRRLNHSFSNIDSPVSLGLGFAIVLSFTGQWK
jgi:hypothetical protein